MLESDNFALKMKKKKKVEMPYSFPVLPLWYPSLPPSLQAHSGNC